MARGVYSARTKHGQQGQHGGPGQRGGPGEAANFANVRVRKEKWCTAFNAVNVLFLTSNTREFNSSLGNTFFRTFSVTMLAADKGGGRDAEAISSLLVLTSSLRSSLISSRKLGPPRATAREAAWALFCPLLLEEAPAAVAVADAAAAASEADVFAAAAPLLMSPCWRSS